MKQNQLDQKAMELQAQEIEARRAVATSTKVMTSFYYDSFMTSSL